MGKDEGDEGERIINIQFPIPTPYSPLPIQTNNLTKTLAATFR